MARRGADVIASDLTPAMLKAARAHIQEQGFMAKYVQVDAQHVSFKDNSLDLVTSRIAPHHFPDPAEFVRECARIVRPGGVVGLVDQVGPEEANAAQYVNAFERLRDPSHVWEYSQSAWVHGKLSSRRQGCASGTRNWLATAWNSSGGRRCKIMMLIR
jgi:ubiquinone/menaquinone biosynthesis C-methylase UbiE